MKYKYGERRRASEYEKALADWWKKNKTFEKSIEQRDIDDSYVFYDGPPFITGMPHHGTLRSSVVKDAVPRFWTMNGKRVERRWGWDCHGLPAENFVIYDENHGMFGVHPAREEWYLVSADESETLLQMGDTDEEKGYQDLFRYFCERITIESRRNPALQRNMLPIRFRGNMTEFQRESVCGLPTEKGVR